MKKELLLKKIDEAVMHEEEAIPIYAEHISTMSYWAGMSNKSVKEILGYLKILHKDSAYHVRAFKTIKKIVNQEQ